MKNKKIVGISCLAAVGVIALCVCLNGTKYDSIGEYNEFGLAKAEKSGKFGYIDEDKKEIIPVTFDSIEDFTDSGMAVVTNEKNEGVYRFDGTCILPLRYQEIELGKVNAEGIIPVSLNGEENFMDLDGSVLFETAEDGPMSLLKVQSDGRYGFADQDGTVILPCDYTELEVLNDNGDNALLILDGNCNFMDAAGHMLYDEVAGGDEDGWFLVKLNGICGYVTASNEEVIPVKYASLAKEGKNSDGYIRLAADGKLLLTDERGTLLYQETCDFGPNGLAAVQNQDGLWGYIDKEGETAAACIYDEIESFNEYGLSRVRSGDLYGYIDEAGVQVIQCLYDETGSFNEYGLSRVRSGDLYGYIDKTGVQVIPCIYDEIEFNEYGIAKAREDQEISFLSSAGQKLFDKVGTFSGKGVACAEKENVFFFIDDNGRRINEKDYDEIRELQDTEGSGIGGFLICKGVRYGLADADGQEIISPEYDEEGAKEIAEEEYSLWIDFKTDPGNTMTQAFNAPVPELDLPEIILHDSNDGGSRWV